MYLILENLFLQINIFIYRTWKNACYFKELQDWVILQWNSYEIFEIDGSMFEYILITMIEEFCVLDGWVGGWEGGSIFSIIIKMR